MQQKTDTPNKNSVLHSFSATLDIIGINPFVAVPEPILQSVFRQAGKDKGAIPVKGSVNKISFRQTLVRYQGDWRLYINTKMLPKSPERIGELLRISLEFDPEERTIPIHPQLLRALQENPDAQEVFNRLRPSLQKEIVRYISFLKSEAAIAANVEKAIGFLLGENRFVGRDKP